MRRCRHVWKRVGYVEHPSALEQLNVFSSLDQIQLRGKEPLTEWARREVIVTEICEGCGSERTMRI